MSQMLSMDWPKVMRAEAAEAQQASADVQAPAAAPHENPEILQSRLHYVRRYGPIMGLCLYELDASLRVSAGSAGGVTYPSQEPSMKR